MAHLVYGALTDFTAASGRYTTASGRYSAASGRYTLQLVADTLLYGKHNTELSFVPLASSQCIPSHLSMVQYSTRIVYSAVILT